MRTMAFSEFGDVNVLKVCDLPQPACGEGDLLIEVHAAALNPVDTKIRKGAHGPRAFPFVPGFDVSGVVRAMGKGVSGFRVGDEVFASPFVTRNGSCAEYVAVDARSAAKKPKNVDHATAAAMPLATITAWEALHQRAAIHEGERIVIHAGAGGVGHIAVQLAKLHGCEVITTASRPETFDLCNRLGADHVIDHKQVNWVQAVMNLTGGRGCAVVVDTVGGQVFDQCIDAVAANGRLVTIVRTENPDVVPRLFRKNATLHCEFMCAPAYHDLDPSPQGQILQTVAELMEADKLRPHISRTLSLEQVPEGHAILESGKAIGKIVVKIR